MREFVIDTRMQTCILRPYPANTDLAIIPL